MSARDATRFRTVRYGLVAAAVASIAIVGFLAIVTVLNDVLEDTGTRVITSAIVVLLSSLAVLANTLAIEKERFRVLGLAAGTLVIGAAVVWFIVIWRPWPYNIELDLGTRLALTATFVAVALTMYGQLLLLQSRFAILRLARHVVGLLCVGSSILATTLLWEIVPTSGMSQFLSFTVPVTIAAIVGLLTVPTVIRLVERRSVASAETLPLKVTLQMTCPKCGGEQVLQNGPVRCTACGYAMIIEIEEPRCECGYLLYRLSGTVCPECGRDVPQDQHWLAGTAAGDLPGATPPQYHGVE